MGGTPTETVFHLSPHSTSGCPSLLLERGVHKPSPAESLAPFHHDPSQRIVVLHRQPPSHHLVLRIGALLELLGSHEGSEVGWDEWNSHVVALSTTVGLREHIRVWVSGCRLFSLNSTNPDLGAQMEVHDFSMRGRVNYLSKQDDEGLAVRYLQSTGVRARVKLGHVINAHSGHDSIAFFGVSAAALSCCLWESD